nr:carbon-nitrogen hydrolase family protein [uncultured Cohaesibacter sp.]
MKIAVCQVNSKADKAENTKTALRLLDEAAKDGAEVAVLPECLDYMGVDEGVYENSEEEGGPLWSALSAKAKELGIWVLGGTFRVRSNDEKRVGNTLVVFNPEGDVTATYRKLHMFDIQIPGEVDFVESRTVKPGEEIVTTEIAGVKSGLSICYDLRFPELFRLQALAGAKILFLPAAFTAFTGNAHWELLLRARAIENGCFVVACGQCGEYLPGHGNYGNSMIIDPWGKILARAGEEVGVTTAEIDIAQFDSNRQIMPSINNRRTDIYSLAAVK